MVRRFIGIGIVSVLSVCSFGQGTTHGRALLDDYNKAIYGAKSLSVTFSSQTITGSRSDYKVDMAKPNKARIETPHVVIVADGSNITTYSKDRLSFCKQPQTDSGLLDAFQGDALSIWKPFFDANGIEGQQGARSQGTIVRKNMSLLVLQLQMNMDASKTSTLFLDPQDNLPRQAQFESQITGSGETLVLDTKTLTLNGEFKPSAFEFNAPDGVKEQTPDEFFAERWYVSLDDAIKVASRTNKQVLALFFNRSVKQSNIVERDIISDPTFKALSKDFVFVRLDIPRSKSTNLKYKVTKSPTIVFIDKAGTSLTSLAGKFTIDDVLASAATAKQMAAGG